MDGYETAAMIRQRKKTKDLPILFLTAYRTADVDIVKTYIEGGASRRRSRNIWRDGAGRD